MRITNGRMICGKIVIKDSYFTKLQRIAIKYMYENNVNSCISKTKRIFTLDRQENGSYLFTDYDKARKETYKWFIDIVY